VLNRPDVFKDFSSAWFEPLARLVVSKDNGGNGFNYFVRDICLLFLRWDHFTPALHQKPIVNAFMVHSPFLFFSFSFLFCKERN
jgi:hypothetical protein